MEHFLILLSIILGCGLLGGAVNYWSVSKEIVESEDHPVLKRLSAGVAAALAVPLFLNMISSDLLQKSKENDLQLLVVAGFCVIAAISSKAFIDSLSKKLLSQLDNLNQEQKNLRNDMEPVLVKETEPEELVQGMTLQYDIDDDDYLVLKALGGKKWSMRTMSGVMADTKFGDVKAAYSLSKLCELSLARRNTKNGKDWWWLTSQGTALYKSKYA